MGKKVNIIAYKADSSACWYYRLHLPLSFMAKSNEDKYMVYVVGHMDKRQMGAYDVAILQRQYRSEVLLPTLELKKHGAKLIYEIDDDLFSVPKWSPAYKHLSKKIVKDNVKRFLSQVDAVFVTTEHLKNVYKEYNENVYVLPNSIALEALNEPPRNSKKKVVCWQGSNTHKNDLKLIEPALKHLISTRDDTLVKLWGASLKGTYNVPLVSFENFYQMLSQVDVDIGLAPVTYIPFNKSKSNLKFLEYTAVGAATVASNFGPYKDTITHGENGLLADSPQEWTTAIEFLLNNEKERLRLVKNAKKLLMEKYDLTVNYKLWENAILKTIGEEQ